MDRQTLRDWVHRFNAAGPPGASSTIGRRVPSLACRRSNGPSLRRSSRPGWIVRRTASWSGRIDLKRVIAERFGVNFHPRYVGKL